MKLLFRRGDMAEISVSYFVSKLTNLLDNEVNLVLGVEREIKSLQNELQWILSFLKDADTKSKDNERIRIWVSQIRDVAYEAEDIIDTFILHQRRHGTRFLRKVTRPITQLAGRHDVGQQIEEIKVTIQDISANKSKYGIESIQEAPSSSSISAQPWKHRKISSAVEESDVVGIEEDVKTLVGRLVHGGSGRTVISIVGMGGLGKTTLAKKVYNSNDVKRHFSCHAWVSVSQEYSMKLLLQGLIRTVMVLSDKQMEMLERMDADDLGKKLVEYLEGRRYLIVVDDIWNLDAWDAFQPVFPDGMNGSRVLLTTRNKDIALHADARSFPHELKFLPANKCWELFCKKTLLGNVQPHRPPELDLFGKKILAKCAGLPLAIVVVGGMLSRREMVPSEWEKVYKRISWQFNDGQNRISRILALSYNDLPSYLKPCFLYLGAFPEDTEIPTRKLIKYWIAEGFVQQREAETMEEVAEDYLEELIHRSMIQVAKRSCNGRVKACRIHDLLRDFSISEAKEGKFFDIYDHDDSISSTVARRLLVYHDNVVPKHSLKNLRSFLRFTIDEDLYDSYCKKFFGGLKLVRVLDLEGASLSHIPKEIGQLIHLRYLGLRKTSIATLPSSISQLCNLQTLDIRETYCRNLPKKFWKNQSLRHLSMGRCSFQAIKVVHETRIALPKRIELGHLRNLKTLTGIMAGNWIGHSLGKLTSLCKLGIGRVSHLHGKELASSLEKLDNLQSLWLEGDAIPTLTLLNNRHLHRLYLLGGLYKLPNPSEFPTNLTKLFLQGSKLEQNPFSVLMDLPNLRILGLLRGSYIGKELYCFGGGFPLLEEMVMQLDGLEDWIMYRGAMPRLRSLSLTQCARLKAIPEEIANMTNLRELKLSGTPLSQMADFSKVHGGSYWSKIEHVPLVIL